MKRYTNEDNLKDKSRFKLLMEYDFYVSEDETEDEENIEGDNAELDADPDMGGDSLDPNTEEEPDATGGEPEMSGDPTDPDGGEDFPEDPEMDADPFAAEEPPMDEPLPEPEPMEDEVELDVTELVQGTEAAKASADEANSKAEMLLAKFDDLNKSLERMSQINSKIENLENEIEKRNPTPEEKLEMRSLSSYPYNLKLTDFWSEKEGNYDAMGSGKKNEEEEYVLTQDEIDRDFNPQEIKNSFRDGKDYLYNSTF